MSELLIDSALVAEHRVRLSGQANQHIGHHKFNGAIHKHWSQPSWVSPASAIEMCQVVLALGSRNNRTKQTPDGKRGSIHNTFSPSGATPVAEIVLEKT